MKTDWRKYEITEDDAEQIGGYVVYTTEADVEAAGKKANFDLGDGIYSDINVARMRARDLSGDYPYHVSTYATWVKGMADDIDQKESDIIAEMREMIALGWEKQEAYDKYDEFIDRLNGDGDLTEGLTKDDILTMWENANKAQAEEMIDPWEVASREDLFFQDSFHGYIGSLEYTGAKFTREKWEEIIRTEDENPETRDDVISALLDWLEEDGYVLSEGEYAAGRKALDSIGFTEMPVETAMNDDTLTFNDGRDGKTYAWVLAEHAQAAVEVESLRELSEKEIEDILA